MNIKDWWLWATAIKPGKKCPQSGIWCEAYQALLEDPSGRVERNRWGRPRTYIRIDNNARRSLAKRERMPPTREKGRRWVLWAPSGNLRAR